MGIKNEVDIYLEGKKEFTTLVGGFKCRLSCIESNKWHEYITRKDIYLLYSQQRGRLEFLRQFPSSIAELESLIQTMHDTENQLYILGKRWYNRLTKA
jgi:hypothetical protein